MNRRKSVIALAMLGAAPFAARAQPARKLPVVGYMHPGLPPPAVNPTFIGMRDGLRDLGYVDGETIKIEARFGAGKPDALMAMAQDLARLKVDVLVAVSPVAVKAARAATTELPIFGLDLETDPIAAGLVTNLARPNGNITGLYLNLPGLAATWLQLLREVVPGSKRVAVLWDANTGPYQVEPLRLAAKAVAVELQVLEFRGSAEMDSVLGASLKARPQALLQLGSPLINQGGPRIAEFLLKNRLPGISPFRSFADGGGVISYGPNLQILYRRMAPLIVRILKGAKPADLPIEQPTHYEMILNLKTAKMLGVKIPQHMLLRADQVIE